MQKGDFQFSFFHRYTCSIEISQGTLNHSEEVNVYPIDIPQIVETDDGIVEVSRQFLGRLKTELNQESGKFSVNVMWSLSIKESIHATS